MLSSVNKEWKSVLESAVSKFRAAGAPEADIRTALQGHLKIDELDIRQEPDVDKEAEVKPETKAPEAKGLPSLEVKKKSKGR